jgi:hypothetical protein
LCEDASKVACALRKEAAIMDESLEFSARASLVMLGLRFQSLGVWSTIAEHVKIKQKVRQHTPIDKLLDCFINILAGGSGLVEINTRVRPDHSVQRAFGRTNCAEQSTTSRTLNACTPENVTQLQTALTLILRQHSRSYRHDYAAHWQVLDVDVTGMPAGRQGEGVTKGYFAKSKNRRGRQLGRVLATEYDEIVVDRLFTGKRQLDSSLQELITTAEKTLELSETKRKNTILRMDGGGGDDDNINRVLNREYSLLVKIKSWRRAQKLAATVETWFVDSKVPNREIGWVEKTHPYAKPTRQLAVRQRKANGEWSYHILVFNLTDTMLFHLLGQPMPSRCEPKDLAFAALHAYDRRGGGVETQNKGDKQGLGLSRRNKHSFAAQEMLVLLAQLAHDVVIWTRNDLAQADGRLQKFGIQRTVRDALQIPGRVQVNAQGQVEQVMLNRNHPLAAAFQTASSNWQSMDHL